MNPRSGGRWPATWTTITVRVVIFRLGRTLRTEERLNRPSGEGLLPCPRWAGFTIDTNAEPHKLLWLLSPEPLRQFQLPWDCRQAIVSLTNCGPLVSHNGIYCSLSALRPPATTQFDPDRVFSNDTRLMRDSDGFVQAYNVQAAVEDTFQLIVGRR
jgi:hypothetical protein